MIPRALPGVEICHKSLFLTGNLAVEKKGTWMSRMICVTCTPFCDYVPAASEKMNRGKTVAVVVVLMGWFCLKNYKKAVDKKLGEKKIVEKYE